MWTYDKNSGLSTEAGIFLPGSVVCVLSCADMVGASAFVRVAGRCTALHQPPQVKPVFTASGLRPATATKCLYEDARVTRSVIDRAESVVLWYYRNCMIITPPLAICNIIQTGLICFLPLYILFTVCILPLLLYCAAKTDYY